MKNFSLLLLALILLLPSSPSFAEEEKEENKELITIYNNEDEMYEEKYSDFMPGALAFGAGGNRGSDHLGMGTSYDFHGWYFPVALMGLGAFYEYSMWTDWNSTTTDIDGRLVGLELLFRFVFDPLTYIGFVYGYADFIQNDNTEVFKHLYDTKNFYGMILGINYKVNDAFSLGPTFRYNRVPFDDSVDNLSFKLELQYRFVLYL